MPDRDGRPKILLLPALFAVGGVERNTIAIVRALRNEFRFYVVTNEPHTDAGGCLLSEIDPYCELVVDLAAIYPRSQHLSQLALMNAEISPDLIWICNGSVWLHENISAIHNLFSHIPIINQEIYDDQEGWIAHIDPPIALKQDRFIAINNRIRRALIEQRHVAAQKIDLIYPVLDNDRASDPFALQRDVSIRKYALIGRLTDQKRPEDFVRLASAYDQKAARKARFYIAGDGPLMSECKRLIERLHAPVEMLGYQKDVVTLLSTLDGVVFTSAYEGLPVVLLESIASGVPVFSTDVGDVALVARKYGGIAVTTGHFNEMINDFLNFDEEHEHFKSAAIAASIIVRRDFSVSAISALYVNCWERAWQDRAKVDLNVR